MAGEALVGLVGSHGDAFELLELAEEVLDQVAPFVDVRVDSERLGAPGMLGDDDLGAAFVRSAMIQSVSKALSAIRRRRRCPRSAARRPPCRSGGRAAARSAPGCRARRSARGSWSSSRPLTCRWPGFGSPFCALSVAVDFDDGGVDHGELHVRVVREGIENPLEDIGLYPVAEPLEHRVPVPEQRAADRAMGCLSGRSTAPPRETAGCLRRCVRDPSACPDNAARSLPIARPSVQISPSAAQSTTGSAPEAQISTDPSADRTYPPARAYPQRWCGSMCPFAVPSAPVAPLGGLITLRTPSPARTSLAIAGIAP